MAKRQIKRPDPQTYEDFLERAHEQFRCLGADNIIPPSNYPFRIGQPVSYGGYQECLVEELLENGRLLLLSYADKGERRGEPYDNQRRLPVLVWWVNVEPLDEIQETNFSRPRIACNYMQHDLRALISRVYHRGLIDSPEYQRDYVWTLEDKQRLIRSIFNRTDIGKFIFLEHEYPENRLEVIDGKQRLNAILEFTQGHFTFEGKTWFQLSWLDKRSFHDLMVQSADLDAKRMKKSDILWLFLSINTAGVPQTEAHVAKTQKMYEEALEGEQNAISKDAA